MMGSTVLLKMYVNSFLGNILDGRRSWCPYRIGMLSFLHQLHGRLLRASLPSKLV